MKNNGRLRRIAGAPLMAGICALALAACTQDYEMADAAGDANGEALPEGMYPLQIGSISVSAEGSGQPWGAEEPQTRVSENSDGSGSVFTDGDVIGVSLGENTTTYTYNGSTWTSTNPLYWKDTNKATVTAWYPVADEIDFTQQDQGLPYLLKATTSEASYENAVSLTFTHQLAKVRVVLTGTKASKVADVKIRSHQNASISQGTLSNSNSPAAYYPMFKTTYGNTTCWEANMIPGTLIANNSFQISKSDGTTSNVTLAGNVPITAGYMHTITITVKSSVVPDDAKEITGNIGDSGNYYINSTRTSAINITGGSPHIYLDEATVSVSSGNAISITGNASPTIHVVGENTLKNSKSNGNSYSNGGAGIYVADGSTVTITGNSRTDDVLTVQGACGGCGIGGYLSGLSTAHNSGNIVIKDVTISATGSYDSMDTCSPAIGAAGSGSCGTITIDNATVDAKGVYAASSSMSSSAIGAGINYYIYYNKGTYGTITIKNNSVVNVQRGNSYSDYIGSSGAIDNQATGATDATTISSTVNKLN